MIKKQKYIIFYSPGSFISETDECKVDSFDIKEAVKTGPKVVQRHGAKPHEFKFL